MQQLQNLAFATEWRGLLSRRHDLDLDRHYAEIARNVEFYGGTVAKRLGTSYVNTCATRVTGLFAVVPSFILDVSHLDVDRLGGPDVVEGTVVTTGCFRVGDTVTVVDETRDLTETATVTGIVGNVITLAGLSFVPQPGDLVLIRRPLNGTARVDGLFQATFRSGVQALIAACGDGLFSVRQAPLASPRLVEALPATTVDATWGSTTTGTLANVETIRADGSFGEHIRIAGAGPGGGVYSGRVTAVVFSTRTITVTPATTTPPAAGAAVTLFPARVPGDTHFVQHANLTHVVSEKTPSVKITPGLVVQRHGVLPPIEPVPAVLVPGTLVAAGGGWTYRIKYLNRTTGQQSEPGPEMAAPVVPATQGVQLTITRSPDPQVDAIDIYRTTDGGAGAWYFLAEIDNPSTLTTTYVDNATDDALGLLMREFLDNVMPDGVGDARIVTVISLWAAANQLVGCDTVLGSVPYSDQFDLDSGFLKPEAWPPANFLLVNYDDGDKPRAVASFFDSLMVFKERSVFRVLNLPPDIEIQPVIFRQDLTGVGTFNQKAVVVDQDEMVFPGQDGFYLLSRYQGVQQGFQSSRISREIDTEWRRIVQGAKQKTHGVFFRERRQLRMFLPMDLGQEPNETLVYQFEGTVMAPGLGYVEFSSVGRPLGWSEWDVPQLPDGTSAPSRWPQGYTASCVAHFTNAPDVVFVGTLRGDVLRMDTGPAEADVFPYTFQYRTIQFTPSGPGIVCRARAIDLVSVPEGDVSLTLRYRTDFDDPGTGFILNADTLNTAPLGGVGDVKVPLTPTGGGFILNQDRLNSGRLGGGASHRRDRVIVLARGEYHRIEWFERSATARFRLQSWTLWQQALPAQVQQQTVVQRL